VRDSARFAVQIREIGIALEASEQAIPNAERRVAVYSVSRLVSPVRCRSRWSQKRMARVHFLALALPRREENFFFLFCESYPRRRRALYRHKSV
jgi:hypothetical protein